MTQAYGSGGIIIKVTGARGPNGTAATQSVIDAAIMATEQAENAALAALAAAGNVQPTSYEFDAVAGQTDFILPFSLSVAPIVYHDGVRLSDDDFTYSGDTVTLNKPSIGPNIDGDTDKVIITVGEASLTPYTTADRVSQVRRASLGGDGSSRSATSKFNERFDLRDYAGLDLTSNNDNASLFQKAVNQAFEDRATLHIPTGNIAIDSTITVANPISIVGDTNSIGRAIAGYVNAPTGPASNLHFTHSGEGIRFDGSGGVYDGVLLRDLMFTRDQPPVYDDQLWEPNDHDYDLVMFGMAGLHIENVMMLNPTRGINMLGGGAIGRLFTNNLMMQPFKVGVNVELSADVVRMSNTHFWPFWRDHLEVNRYTVNNCDHVYLKRCDTPMFTNFFSIAARSAFRIGKVASGSVTKMKVSNYDVDYSQYCIWFDDTATNAWARFSNGTLQANNAGQGSLLANIPASPTRQNLRMDGAACFAAFDGLEISGASHTAMDVGIGNRLEISGDFWVQNYGETVPYTAPCINVGANSTLVLHGRVYDTSGPGGAALGPLVAGSGIVMGYRKAFAPSVTPSTGTYATVALIDREYIEDGYRVSGTVNLRVDDIGTGAGSMTITAPTDIDISTLVNASNSATGELLRAITVAGNPGSIVISNQSGGNVAVNGQVINISFDYNKKGN